MEKNDIIFGIGILFGIITITLVILASNQPIIEIEEVDCYDDHNHKIQELTCEKETQANMQWLIPLISAGGVLMILFMFGGILMNLNDRY